MAGITSTTLVRTGLGAALAGGVASMLGIIGFNVTRPADVQRTEGLTTSAIVAIAIAVTATLILTRR